MPDRLVEVIRSGVEVFDLGREMYNGMPQSPNHPAYKMVLQRRHGDGIRADGGSAASEMLITGGHVGTHIDALAHVSHCGSLYGGVDAAQAQTGGEFSVHGVNEIPPMFTRGVLLDIPAYLGVEVCEPAYEITSEDLEGCAARQGTEIGAGDVVLIRSGWARQWDKGAEAYLGHSSGVPGTSEQGAKWLASMGVLAAGADTIAFEWLAPGAGHALLPAHRVLLVEEGINIIETLNLEELAASGNREFAFVCSPLNLRGATGSPVRPLAVVGK